MLYRTSLNAPVFGLRREIDRLFEDTFGRDNASSWTPAVDVRENQNELRLDLELPGINADDVEITTDNGVLTVRGEKHSERKEEDDARYHVVERSYGSFTRSFQLPQGLDDSRIEASFDNGILSIHIPKSALPQPKKIHIKGVSSGSGMGNQQQVGGNVGGQQPRMSTGGSPQSGDQPNTNQMAANSSPNQGAARSEGSSRNEGSKGTGRSKSGGSTQNS
jgi:HSP20 family protein